MTEVGVGLKRMKILVLNSGSSSQKSALFALGSEAAEEPVPSLWEGKLQWDGDKEELHIRGGGQEMRHAGKPGVHRSSVAGILKNLRNGTTAVLKSANEIAVVGHRIVHGG